MLRSVQDQTKHGTNFAQRFHLSISSNSNILEWDHSRFLVNQTNSRSKTTTIPCFATTRHARLDYAIKSRFCNRGSITHSSLDFVIEARFSNRASFLHPTLVFKKERKKERKKGRKERRKEGRKKEREKEYCKLKN